MKGIDTWRQGKTDFVEPDMDLSEAELDALRIDSKLAHGPLRHLGPVLHLSETQPHWSRPTPLLGGDVPEWLGAMSATDAAE